MDSIILIFEIVLPILYFASTWLYAKAFFSGVKSAETLKTPALFITLGFHSLYIITRTITYQHFPITSLFEILTLIAFTITLVYSFIEMKIKNRTTGYFILILPFMFQLTSSIFIKERSSIPEILHSNLLGFHVSSALLGYAALAISAVYGFLYLMLYHKIKSSQFGVIYNRLPNLEVLLRMSETATIFGFSLLTASIVLGLVMLNHLFDTVSYTDPKLYGTIATWILYATGLTAKKVAGWQGRRLIVLSIAGFVIAVFSMTVVNLFFSGFHNFQ